MDTQKIQEITKALGTWVSRYASARQASVALGVSSATLSNILNGKVDKISDEMWARIAAAVQAPTGTGWVLAETTAYQEICFAFDNARADKAMTWLVGDAGCGKTSTANSYTASHAETYYVLCSEDMKRGDFLRALARPIGVRVDGLTVSEVPRAIAAAVVERAGSPLIILDEADKLADSVLAYLIGLYNMLEGVAGIVLLSTNHIVRRMATGLRYSKRGYNELHSRMGRRFYSLSGATANDIYAVCLANGVGNDAIIRKVVVDADEYDNDFRRVHRSILRELKIAAAQ